MTQEQKNPLKLRLSLSLLDELGVNLYSNVPAVISEVVANAWDADATKVKVNITNDHSGKIVVITDNGNGMSEDDIRNKFLIVGYHRRDRKDGDITPKFKRATMGRKGIGKLSLFSVAEEIEIHSKYHDNQGIGETAFVMDGQKIRQAIKDGREHDCHLERIAFAGNFPHEHGTQIVLRSLTKRVSKTSAKALRKRLARRFGIRCTKEMEISLHDEEGGGVIGMEDRDYFGKLEYIFQYGGENLEEYCSSDVSAYSYPGKFDAHGNPSEQGGFGVHGWIGFTKKSSDLKIDGESLNAIAVMAREKIMHEDILGGFGFGSMFTKYAIGEIHANFLDEGEEDIATSSRQRVVEDSPRFKSLSNFLRAELRRVGDIRDKENHKKGKKEAIKLIPLLEEWFSEMEGDDRRAAESFFGNINKIGGSDEEKQLLFAHAVPAFESYRFTKNLNALAQINAEHMGTFLKIAGDLGKLESVYYHKITKARLAAIKKMEEAVEKNALEKVIRDLLFDHLWLLHPSWAEGTEVKERTIAKIFEQYKKNDEKSDAGNSRVDILFRKAAGAYVIVELKRPDRSVDSADLEKQVRKYKNAAEQHAEKVAGDRHPENVEVVCILGDIPEDWKQGKNGESEGRSAFRSKHIRVLTYDKLLHDTRRAHEEYLEKWTDKENKILDAVEKIMAKNAVKE